MSSQQKSNWINITLWILQGLLALAFGMAGFLKSTAPMEQLAQNGMTFVNEYSVGMVRFIGITEILGALGLILPAVLRIKPILTPLAALGFTIIMVLAAVQHISSNEPIIANIVFLVICIFIIWGRLSLAPIKSK